MANFFVGLIIGGVFAVAITVWCFCNSKKDGIEQANEIEELKAENEELAYKLGCLLCHATGGKLSKHTYSLGIMESYVNDTIQDYCNEATEEAKTKAYKEFAEELKKQLENHKGMSANNGNLILYNAVISAIDFVRKALTKRSDRK